jgi:ubiquinone biosynthesis protein UbiJ
MTATFGVPRVPGSSLPVSGGTYNLCMASHPLSWIGQMALPKLTLLLNHIVSSEPIATAKLQAHAGRTIDIRWVSGFKLPVPTFLARLAPSAGEPGAPWRFVITPAGLFESSTLPGGARAATDVTPANGLTVTVHLPDPLSLARQTLKGERPEVNIEGDAALAEVVSWLMKNLRWDVQDDVARWLGTAPAELLRSVGESLRAALARWRPQAGGQPGSPGSHR